MRVRSKIAARAQTRAAATPFFLIDEGPQFAVVVAVPEHRYVDDGKNLSLVDAVMRLDVSKLVASGAARA